jgi:hypothetical protein
METDRYSVDRGAKLWFLELDPADRAALDAAIAPLVDLPEKDWPAKGAIRLALPKPTFMLKLGPRLRVFVRPTPSGKPAVQDFVNQGTLDMFKERMSTKGPSARRGVGKRKPRAAAPHEVDEPGENWPIFTPEGNMETELCTIDSGAMLWFLRLDPADRAALDAAITPLVDLPENDWPAKGAIRLGLPKPTFMLKLGPRLRVFVRPTPGGKPFIQDFVHQETLDWFKSLVSTQEPSAPLRTGKPSGRTPRRRRNNPGNHG